MTTMQLFPTGLNEAGRDHVESELERLDLNWSVLGTCGAIEQKAGFMELVQGETYEHEISNIDAGKDGYGVFGWIEIEADKHVLFEPATD